MTDKIYMRLHDETVEEFVIRVAQLVEETGVALVLNKEQTVARIATAEEERQGREWWAQKHPED